MLTGRDVQELLEPFGLALNAEQVDHVLTYLGLLLNWNQRINLTAVRRPEECITRHFGESLLLSRHAELRGRLLDIGSGAGFPGLALKIICPNLWVTLLEPSSKKRAFLKEVARSCGWEGVEVRAERLEELETGQNDFDFATARAVGSLARLIPHAAKRLRAGGRLCLWLGKGQLDVTLRASKGIEWQSPIPVPLSRAREVWIGVKS